MNGRRCIAVVTAAVCAAVISCATFGARHYEDRQHGSGTASIFYDGTYHNALPTGKASFGSVLEVGWKLLTEGHNNTPPPHTRIIERKGDAWKGPAPDFRITWLGHSTVLIEMDGMRILTDPIFSERASPLEHAGPRRLHRAPVSMEDLPALDAVVISHDHYDHLDYRSIRGLKDKTGHFYVPLDVGAHLVSWGVPREKIVEFDWWERKRIGENVYLAAAPARHFSGREPVRFNRTLWSSWIIIGSRRRVFFCGDSGMMPEFSRIGREYGPIDVTLLPIGAYDARWPDIHMTPEEALEAHGCLEGRVLLPIHWGTFNLAPHGWSEPAERLIIEARRVNAALALPRPGEPVSPDGMAEMEPWWR